MTKVILYWPEGTETVEKSIKKEGKSKIMTNKEWLATLSAEEFYEQYMAVRKKAMFDINTRAFIIEWLDKEHTKEDEHKITYF